MSPTLNRRYQVFVSSTYEDLIEERSHVIQALLETRSIPVGMELFPASTEEKWALIRRLIDDCDYFIVVVAGMYGRSPTAAGPSYTEMEFDYAVQRGMKPIGFFHANIGALPSAKVERLDAVRQKLEAFTDKVKHGMCAKWLSPAELGSAVKSAMINAFDHDPKPGWTKATTLPGAAELSVIRDAARKQSQHSTVSAATILGDEVIKIPVVDALQQLRREKITNHGTFDYRLRDIFASIATGFDKPKPARVLKTSFLKTVEPAISNMNETQRERGHGAVSWTIPKDFFDRVLKTFMAKGLVTQVLPPRHLRSRKSLYWQLTSAGRQERASLEALV